MSEGGGNNSSNGDDGGGGGSKQQQQQRQRWFPLESNPGLMNKYIRNLGFDTSLYEFVDVYSTEDWALDMIPQPVIAVIMLYPLTQKQIDAQKEKKDSIANTNDDLNSIWFIKQRIGNACGTIGLLHSLLNVPEPIRSTYQSESWLETFQNNCPNGLDPVVKAEILENDNNIAVLHDEATSSTDNQTSRGHINDRVETHFITLTCINNKLYELDGRKEGPVIHGTNTTQMTLLKDACNIVVKQFMNNDPHEMRFTIMALAPKQE